MRILCSEAARGEAESEERTERGEQTEEDTRHRVQKEAARWGVERRSFEESKKGLGRCGEEVA